MSVLTKSIGAFAATLSFVAVATTLTLGAPNAPEPPLQSVLIDLVDMKACEPTNAVVRIVPEGGTVWEEISLQTRADHPEILPDDHELRVWQMVNELREFVDPDNVPAGFSFVMNGKSGFVLTHPVELVESPVHDAPSCESEILESPPVGNGSEVGEGVTESGKIPSEGIPESPPLIACVGPNDFGVCVP